MQLFAFIMNYKFEYALKSLLLHPFNVSVEVRTYNWSFCWTLRIKHTMAVHYNFQPIRNHWEVKSENLNKKLRIIESSDIFSMFIFIGREAKFGYLVLSQVGLVLYSKYNTDFEGRLKDYIYSHLSVSLPWDVRTYAHNYFHWNLLFFWGRTYVYFCISRNRFDLIFTRVIWWHSTSSKPEKLTTVQPVSTTKSQ